MIAAVPDFAELVRVARPVGPESAGAFALVLMAVLAVVLLVVVWAVFIRKPSRGRRRERGRLTTPPPPEDAKGESSGRRRRRRRSRTEVRNPTLAETGGLPPWRDPAGPPDDRNGTP